MSSGQPADGRWHLGTLSMVSASNAVGPVEIDQSNGGSSQGDGALLTIGGEVRSRYPSTSFAVFGVAEVVPS